MTEWIALSDDTTMDPLGDSLLERGLFVLEFRVPLQDQTILLHSHSDQDWPRTFSVFFDPEVGIALLHRQGDRVERHVLPGPVVQRPGTARISLSFDAPHRFWQLKYEVLGEGISQTSRGKSVLPIAARDLAALCLGGPNTLRHDAVLWFGATQKPSLPERAAWIGLNTPVDTLRGPVRASLLKPGDMIATAEDGFQVLRGLIRRTLPSRGSFAPVILRAPYFGRRGDILVSSDQLVLISGASVEYLYGEDEVLIAAGMLCDGKVAVRDERRAVTSSVALDLGAPYEFTADGCCLISAFGPFDELPRHALRDYEAQPLLRLLGRTALRHTA